MKTRFLCLLSALMLWGGQAIATKVTPSTTLPADGVPEHLYTMVNGNNWYINAGLGYTLTAEKAALFAFYTAANGGYHIYDYSAKKWVTYTQSSGYSDGTNFAKLTDGNTTTSRWSLQNYSDDNYQIAPYNNTGVASKYLNFYGGSSQYTVDATNKTIGLWQQGGAQDAGSRWMVSEVDVQEYVYTVVCPEGVQVIIAGRVYTNGSKYQQAGILSSTAVTATAREGEFAIVQVKTNADKTGTITVTCMSAPQQPESQDYRLPRVYPQQQTEVGSAQATAGDGVYTLYNNVLAASFVKVGDAVYFAGSQAMNLLAGTEPFLISIGNGTEVPASEMTLKSLELQNIEASTNAVGGAEHFDGKMLVGEYEYAVGSARLLITWRAVLRDGSHYLRTEMDLKAQGDIDMYNVIPMTYNVDTRAAGSTPAVVGNTRGAVLISDRIFAGLENPVGYNTVGGATGDEDKYDLTRTVQKSLTSGSWKQLAQSQVPYRVTEATGFGYPNIYVYTVAGQALTANQKVVTTVKYTSGNHRLNFAGADLLDADGSVVASDYHTGYSGNQSSDNTFSFVVPNDGTYTLRVLVQNGTEIIDASSTLEAKIYTPKEGVVIQQDIVAIKGRWSRNTILQDGETWKISAVVGLVAQDGKQSDTNLRKTQKRRSFLAYSERERAVPWRANPVYISWYELNINHNNAAPGNESQNMNAQDVLNVMKQWKSRLYDKHGVGVNSFVIDDGWDNYGTWTFHSGFPNEMRDMATLARQMGAGIGAWLGPVGGYGQSGNYRRNYWNSNNRGGMVLSNPAYYQVFKAAAENLVLNQGQTPGTDDDTYRFFKFDGISAQYSAVGPDEGDTGNENAEGIIRLERYVREELKRDIFFNTTVGTWASPFWYHFTDATWRQENDFSKIGNNSIDRENWITYRDRLVYQNYVQNSPICPINTLMTHGFILHNGDGTTMSTNYADVLRELRCAFVCGSGMVELYNDYTLMNSINNGQLWNDLADCINWQKKNADVLPDAHWVGGNPWDGSKANIYGWASWNGEKCTIALRNGSGSQQTLRTTLREILEIPAYLTGTVTLSPSFGGQSALTGLATAAAIDIDTQLTITIPASSLYVFDGICQHADPTGIETITATIPATVSSSYDLSGRVVTTQHGLYIKNGKKVMK